MLELEEITGLVCLVIAALVVLHFRSPAQSALALFPVLSGFVLTLGIMTALGMKMNFMNVVVFPMLLGIGVDDGIHFVHRWRTETGERWRSTLHGAGLPIIMTSLTSTLGFGSLVLTDNPGLRSVGYTAAIGIGSCLVSTLLFLPPVCRILEKRSKAGSA